MQIIERKHTNQRMSQIVIHGKTVYLAGQVGEPHHDVADQTRDALARIDVLLAEAGSSREQMLQTTIWLADMADFEAMNAVWDAWIPTGHAPARACGEAKLADPRLLVEIIVCAAKG
ncbi:enamine deaminase RidA (YjgF/YER057c/UK114 family) [Pseudomonas sp. JAI111]|uniref:RidA family protein n=1 Tax=Pseudomonas sp. JAI111 TaxID=2735913 RepID=UPI00216A302B|nr:RidA family protein [Pseudomonas sp. JAI111]MCS3838590.1 enamine deaminase RidA (YjgF/YER057c/UK114 family) [Pseudomonas sp. JAI111]